MGWAGLGCGACIGGCVVQRCGGCVQTLTHDSPTPMLTLVLKLQSQPLSQSQPRPQSLSNRFPCIALLYSCYHRLNSSKHEIGPALIKSRLQRRLLRDRDQHQQRGGGGGGGGGREAGGGGLNGGGDARAARVRVRPSPYSKAGRGDDGNRLSPSAAEDSASYGFGNKTSGASGGLSAPPPNPTLLSASTRSVSETYGEDYSLSVAAGWRGLTAGFEDFGWRCRG